jgi:basic membrane protein A
MELNRITRRRKVVSTIGSGMVVLSAGCLGGDTTGGESDNPGSEEVSAAIIYNGPVDSPGYTKVHHDAIDQIDSNHDWINISFNELVNPAESGQVIENFARNNDIVFANSVSYVDPMSSAAGDYPNTNFCVVDALETSGNLAGYNVRYVDGFFLLGQAAGMVTESNQIGILSSFRVPLTYRWANSFANGVNSVNEDATVLLRDMDVWFDPDQAKSITESLIDEGVDVMSQHTDSPSPVKTANDNGIWSIGLYDEFAEFGGKKYLSSVMPDWSTYYEGQIRDIREGSWSSSIDWLGFEEDSLELDTFGSAVPSEVSDMVEESRQQIVDDELDIWQGTQWEGQGDNLEIIWQMNQFVDNIEAS